MLTYFSFPIAVNKNLCFSENLCFSVTLDFVILLFMLFNDLLMNLTRCEPLLKMHNHDNRAKALPLF